MNINPELLLACAKLAKPRPNNSNSSWEIWDGSHGKTIGYIVFDFDGSISEAEEFDPLNSDSDAMALERALKKEGWVFYQTPKGRYTAFDIHGKAQTDDSDTMLLLLCVSAQASIPLLANNTEGV